MIIFGRIEAFIFQNAKKKKDNYCIIVCRTSNSDKMANKRSLFIPANDSLHKSSKSQRIVVNEFEGIKN